MFPNRDRRRSRPGVIRVDHAMARHDDRDWIARVGLAYCLISFRAINRNRNIAITAGFRVRDFCQRAPYLKLKRGSFKVQCHIEHEAFAREEFTLLTLGLAHERSLGSDIHGFAEMNAGEPPCGGRQSQAIQQIGQVQGFDDCRHSPSV